MCDLAHLRLLVPHFVSPTNCVVPFSPKATFVFGFAFRRRIIFFGHFAVAAACCVWNIVHSSCQCCSWSDSDCGTLSQRALLVIQLLLLCFSHECQVDEEAWIGVFERCPPWATCSCTNIYFDLNTTRSCFRFVLVFVCSFVCLFCIRTCFTSCRRFIVCISDKKGPDARLPATTRGQIKRACKTHILSISTQY